MSYCCQINAIKNYDKVYERSGKNLFWCINNSGEELDKLNARNFNCMSLFTYDFYTLYTTCPHNLFKEKLIYLIERTFQRECSLTLHLTTETHFSLQKSLHGLVKMYVMRYPFLLDSMFIQFGTKLYRQVEAAFFYLHLFISNDIVSTKIYDTHDDLILKLSVFLFRW